MDFRYWLIFTVEHLRFFRRPIDSMIGGEGWSRTRMSLETTDFKSDPGVLTSFYNAGTSTSIITIAQLVKISLGA